MTIDVSQNSKDIIYKYAMALLYLVIKIVTLYRHLLPNLMTSIQSPLPEPP